MTQEEQTQAIQNLVERVNRIEATVAHNNPAPNEAIIATIDAAIVLLDLATELYGHNSEKYTRIVDELRNGR